MSIFQDFISFIYPHYCFSCGKKINDSKLIICHHCEYKIPFTNMEKIPNNLFVARFWGRIEIKSAASLYYYSRSNEVQSLLYHLKYKGKRQIGEFLGSKLGEKLSKSEYFKNIDLIIPIPLHPRKKKIRGYNQSYYISKGISKMMNIPYSESNISRIEFTKTQTKNSRNQRFENLKNAFEISNPNELENKNILLVDDVVTTGATFEACCVSLSKIPGIKISLATIAFAIH